ncbi:MAG TPA: hypothetical protein VLN45_07285 [Ignavibacteriaceae bacterium]|nr:hypothetical protein [Ignavibacteriaceae bacterium]
MNIAEARKLNLNNYENETINSFNVQNISRYRLISSDRVEDFFSKGFKKRHFFPHKTFYIPKPGPDGYKIASRIFGKINSAEMFEVVVYAISPVLDEFPGELFFNDDLVWHQQQFGKKGQIATASLLVRDKNLYSMIHLSDVVQRIALVRKYKTKIENRFKGWPVMLLNSILNFGLEKNLENIFIPTSELALEHTDKKRNVQKDLFLKIYDSFVNRYYKTEKINGWWKINLKENIEKVVISEKRIEEIKKEKTICLAHDFEAGYGHIGLDQELVETANKNYSFYLKEILSIEKEFNLPVTYNVVGSLFNEVKDQIKNEGHCLAFHSYNHKIEEAQLDKCRLVDYRIKGYRAPQSKITSDLSLENLLYNNFEWFASSEYSLKINQTKHENGIIKIPVTFDDFSMYDKKISYQDWEEKAIQTIKEIDFVSFSLHDCYAKYWLPHYRNFLKKIHDLGKFKTFNQVAEEEFLRSSI